MKKRLIVTVLVILFYVFPVATSYAATGYTYDLQKNNFIEAHIYGLLNGTVDIVNEDSERNISFYNSEKEYTPKIPEYYARSTFSANETSLVQHDTAIDIISLDEERNEYLATIIVDNTYETMEGRAITSNEDTKNKTHCDVKLAYSAIYQVIELSGGERVKVTKYVGTYVKNNDPQMICSEIKFTSRADGLVYNSSGNYIGTGYKTPDKTISRPQKGLAYEYYTNQQGYVEVPPGNNSGRMHYTLKRTVSSYTTTGYMAFDWGNMFS